MGISCMNHQTSGQVYRRMNDFMDLILGFAEKPALFESGEPEFWCDPHISKSMLEAHLDPDHDAASRRPEEINRTVCHLVASGVLAPGMRVLDLGCGPGLYDTPLCHAGMKVTGLDFSERSIAYAKEQASIAGLDITYRCMDFFDMDFSEEFDAVLQIYGELNTFADEKRDRLLKLIHRALKKNGVFVFDVSTRSLHMKYRGKNQWFVSEGGFWRPGRHLVLEQGFDYPGENVWLDQYIVVDERGAKVYRN